MIMTLFGALSAGTKTYLLCRSDRQAFTSAFCNTLPVELGLDNCSTPTGNSTYTACEMSSEDIVDTHDTFMKSLGIELSEDDKRLIVN